LGNKNVGKAIQYLACRVIFLQSEIRKYQNSKNINFLFLQETTINSTGDELRYSRAYISELATQYREEEMILRVFLSKHFDEKQSTF
jgi:hypothetical protein